MKQVKTHRCYNVGERMEVHICGPVRKTHGVIFPGQGRSRLWKVPWNNEPDKVVMACVQGLLDQAIEESWSCSAYDEHLWELVHSPKCPPKVYEYLHPLEMGCDACLQDKEYECENNNVHFMERSMLHHMITYGLQNDWEERRSETAIYQIDFLEEHCGLNKEEAHAYFLHHGYSAKMGDNGKALWAKNKYKNNMNISWSQWDDLSVIETLFSRIEEMRMVQWVRRIPTKLRYLKNHKYRSIWEQSLVDQIYARSRYEN